MLRVFQTLTNAYHSLLVSRRGAYSVERVLAFHDYCAQTSTLRALLVCFAFPVPSLLMVLLIEAIPLQDLSLGLHGNPTFWLRVAASVVVVLVSFLQLALQAIPEVVITSTTKVLIVAVSLAGFLSFLGALASLWRFPIPFIITIGAPVSGTMFVISWIVFIGLEPLRRIPKLRERAGAFCGLLGVFALMCVSYPTYNAIFLALNSSPFAQNAVILVLPVMRLILRNLAAKACAYSEDLIPETTIFSVEVFNSIYIAQTMQSGNSVVITAAVIAFDFGSSVFTLHRLRQRAAHIERGICLGNPDAQRFSRHAGVLEPLVQAFGDPSTMSFANIRVLGSFPHNVAPTSHRAELLKRVCEATGSTDRFISSRLQPGTSSHTVCVDPVSAEARNGRQRKNQAWIEPSLRLLFQCEYVLLAEYIESIVSATCVVYLAVMFELPNLEYYPYQASIATDFRSWILLRLTASAAIEFASLVFVVVLIQRRLGLSTVKLLAFVLETQFNVAQGMFALCVTVVFQFPLVHYGKYSSQTKWCQFLG